MNFSSIIARLIKDLKLLSSLANICCPQQGQGTQYLFVCANLCPAFKQIKEGQISPASLSSCLQLNIFFWGSIFQSLTIFSNSSLTQVYCLDEIRPLLLKDSFNSPLEISLFCFMNLFPKRMHLRTVSLSGMRGRLCVLEHERVRFRIDKNQAPLL